MIELLWASLFFALSYTCLWLAAASVSSFGFMEYGPALTYAGLCAASAAGLVWLLHL